MTDASEQTKLKNAYWQRKNVEYKLIMNHAFEFTVDDDYVAKELKKRRETELRKIILDLNPVKGPENIVATIIDIPAKTSALDIESVYSKYIDCKCNFLIMVSTVFHIKGQLNEYLEALRVGNSVHETYYTWFYLEMAYLFSIAHDKTLSMDLTRRAAKNVTKRYDIFEEIGSQAGSLKVADFERDYHNMLFNHLEKEGLNEKGEFQGLCIDTYTKGHMYLKSLLALINSKLSLLPDFLSARLERTKSNFVFCVMAIPYLLEYDDTMPQQVIDSYLFMFTSEQKLWIPSVSGLFALILMMTPTHLVILKNYIKRHRERHSWKFTKKMDEIQAPGSPLPLETENRNKRKK